MARIRSVHPGLFTDEAFVSISPLARLLVIGLWTESDDNGVFEWKPTRLKMRIFPADDASVASLLAELIELNIIKKFDFDSQEFGAVRNFRKWQRPKSPQSIHPCPEEIADYTALTQCSEDEAAKPERGTALGKLLAERQDGCCHYCGNSITFYRKKPHSLEVDHRIPLSRGGTDDVDNIVASCRPCNSLKANMTDVEFWAKFAPDELRRRHLSRNPKSSSHFAKNVSRFPKTTKGEIPPQREEVEVRKTLPMKK